MTLKYVWIWIGVCIAMNGKGRGRGNEMESICNPQNPLNAQCRIWFVLLLKLESEWLCCCLFVGSLSFWVWIPFNFTVNQLSFENQSVFSVPTKLSHLLEAKLNRNCPLDTDTVWSHKMKWNRATQSDVKCQQGSNLPIYKSTNYIYIPHLGAVSVWEADQTPSSDGIQSNPRTP